MNSFNFKVSYFLKTSHKGGNSPVVIWRHDDTYVHSWHPHKEDPLLHLTVRCTELAETIKRRVTLVTVTLRATHSDRIHYIVSDRVA